MLYIIQKGTFRYDMYVKHIYLLSVWDVPDDEIINEIYIVTMFILVCILLTTILNLYTKHFDQVYCKYHVYN